MTSSRRPANDLFRAARLRLKSADGSGPMTREEFADRVNAVIDPRDTDGPVAASDIGKIERGIVSWPRKYRRQAYRSILNVKTDAEIGLVNRRVRPTDAAPHFPPIPLASLGDIFRSPRLAADLDWLAERTAPATTFVAAEPAARGFEALDPVITQSSPKAAPPKTEEGSGIWFKRPSQNFITGDLVPSVAAARRHDLTDVQWAALEALLPAGTGRDRPRRWTMRVIIDGIRWRVRTGSPWRDVPGVYPLWQTLYRWLRRWQRDGVWTQILAKL